jgi:hypothetical protein
VKTNQCRQSHHRLASLINQILIQISICLKMINLNGIQIIYLFVTLIFSYNRFQMTEMNPTLDCNVSAFEELLAATEKNSYKSHFPDESNL